MSIQGTKLWSAGETVTAANVNQYLMRGVKVFADAATRDAAYGGAGEPTLAEGETCYLTDSDTLLIYNGSSWVNQQGLGGLALISSTTIGSAVSTVTVSGAFSSTYDNYRVIVSGGAASANLDLRLTLGSTTTGYYYGQFYVVFADGTTNSTNGSNAAFIPVASGTTTTLNGVFDILAPNLAEHTVFLSQGSIASQSAAGFCNGYLADTTAYTAFTLTTSTGTITGGTVKVYGYRN